MTGSQLSKELTKRGRDIANYEVFIGLKPIAKVNYDEDTKRIILIPEVKSKKEKL